MSVTPPEFKKPSTNQKQYWYIEQDEQRGPFSQREILAKGLTDESLIWFEGLDDWTEFKNVRGNLISEPTAPAKRKKSTLLKIGTLIGAVLIIATVIFLYNRYSFSEEEARKAVKNVYQQHKSGKLDVDKSLYPDYQKIGNYLVMTKPHKITGVTEREDGTYEVYTEYLHNKNNPTQISFVVEKSDGKVRIKSSRGLSYLLYDKTYMYGRKKGYFTGQESDAVIGAIDSKEGISSTFKFNQELEAARIKESLSANASLQSSYGYISGNAMIHNGSEYNLAGSDIVCTINFYNNAGALVASEPVSIYGGLRAGATESRSIFVSNSSNFAKYKVEWNLKPGYWLEEQIRERLVMQTD